MPRRRKEKSIDQNRLSPPVTRSDTKVGQLLVTVDEVCDGIMNCLENCDDPIESPTIARSLGDGFNVWTVRENLQLLKDIGIVQKIDKDGWILSNKIMKTDEDKENLATRNTHTLNPEEPETLAKIIGKDECRCPNAGASCQHIHHHVTNNYYQFGTVNTIIQASDGESNLSETA